MDQDEGQPGHSLTLMPQTCGQGLWGESFQETSICLSGPRSTRGEKEDVLLTTMVSAGLFRKHSGLCQPLV